MSKACETSTKIFQISKGLSFSFPLPFTGRPRSAELVQTFENFFRLCSFYLCVLALEPTFFKLFALTPPKISKIGPSDSNWTTFGVLGWLARILIWKILLSSRRYALFYLTSKKLLLKMKVWCRRERYFPKKFASRPDESEIEKTNKRIV